MVKYKNMTDKMVLIRKDISNDKGEIIDYLFYDCKPGDVVDITEAQGKANNFMRVESEPVLAVENIKDADEAPEVEDNDEYVEMLENIKGIGAKTVEDILSEYPTEASIRDAAKDKKHHFPFQNNVSKSLRKVFGE